MERKGRSLKRIGQQSSRKTRRKKLSEENSLQRQGSTMSKAITGQVRLKTKNWHSIYDFKWLTSFPCMTMQKSVWSVLYVYPFRMQAFSDFDTHLLSLNFKQHWKSFWKMWWSDLQIKYPKYSESEKQYYFLHFCSC